MGGTRALSFILQKVGIHDKNTMLDIKTINIIIVLFILTVALSLDGAGSYAFG